MIRPHCGAHGPPWSRAHSLTPLCFLLLFRCVWCSWEGTTNVLSHDLLRVLATTKGAAWKDFRGVVLRRVGEIEAALPTMDAPLRERITKVAAALRASQADLDTFVSQTLSGGKVGGAALESLARALAFGASRVYIATVLAVHALWSKHHLDWVVVERWVMDGDTKQSVAVSPMVPAVLRAPLAVSAKRMEETRAIALDVDPVTKQPRGCGNLNADGTPRARL